MGVRLEKKVKNWEKGKGNAMFFKNIIKSLVILGCICIFASTAIAENITLINTSDHPVYAAIYYLNFWGTKAKIASEITQINAGKTAEIVLPRYKIGKVRELLVSKDQTKLVQDISWISIDLPSNFLGCHHEVGHGKLIKAWYTGKELSLILGI